MAKSNAELEIIEFWNKIEQAKLVSVKDLLKFRDELSKLTMKCEELRKSRDNWRVKYEEKGK